MMFKGLRRGISMHEIIKQMIKRGEAPYLKNLMFALCREYREIARKEKLGKVAFWLIKKKESYLKSIRILRDELIKRGR